MATKSAGVGLALSFLYSGAITQGSADAFKEVTVATPLSAGAASAELCLVVREILIQWPNVNPVSGGNFELTLTRKSQTGMPTPTSTFQSLILKRAKFFGIVTSGGIAWDGTEYLFFDTERAPRIVESNIYAQLDSNGTGAANTAYMRIGYTLESISEADRNSILVATATATG